MRILVRMVECASRLNLVSSLVRVTRACTLEPRVTKVKSLCWLAFSFRKTLHLEVWTAQKENTSVVGVLKYRSLQWKFLSLNPFMEEWRN